MAKECTSPFISLEKLQNTMQTSASNRESIVIVEKAGLLTYNIFIVLPAFGSGHC